MIIFSLLDFLSAKSLITLLGQLVRSFLVASESEPNWTVLAPHACSPPSFQQPQVRIRTLCSAHAVVTGIAHKTCRSLRTHGSACALYVAHLSIALTASLVGSPQGHGSNYCAKHHTIRSNYHEDRAGDTLGKNHISLSALPL